MSYHYHKLSNGLRIIHKPAKSTVSHAGLMVETGSRDEKPEENGMAHLIEHLIFKGTKKRKTWHILSRIENVGGELNAYTTKEETTVYASFLSSYYERTLELFSDVAFRSVFPEKEMEKEKEVIIDEINSYNDSPSELIFDDFEDLLFDGHSLGRNILGTIENIKNFSRKEVLRFAKQHYSIDNMVLASVGEIPFDKLIKLAEKHFGDITPVKNILHRKPFKKFIPSDKIIKKNTYLSHLMIGTTAYSRLDAKKPALMLLNNLLGGPALNSRLNMSIREKYGFAYQIESYYQPYSDSGVFSVYLGTDKKYTSKGKELILKELDKLKRNRIGTLQLQRAKNQFIGQMAISYQQPLNEMLGMAKSHLYRDTIKTFEENVQIIRNITSSKLMEVANEIFPEKRLSSIVYENKNIN